MKLVLVTILLFLFSVGCEKGITPKQETTTGGGQETNVNSADHTLNPKQETLDMQALIQQWTLWAYNKPLALWPNFDPDGHLQDLGQVPVSGVYMLGGGNLQNPYYTRNITIDLAKYQYVFLPLVEMSGWYDECDMSFAPKAGQSPEGFFKSMFTSALNGKRDLSLIWDGHALVTNNNKNEFRVSSGVFQHKIDPSSYTGCTASTTTWYSDGYWAKLPLTVGAHTLVFSGSIDWKKKVDVQAYNEITYNITVINSATS